MDRIFVSLKINLTFSDISDADEKQCSVLIVLRIASTDGRYGTDSKTARRKIGKSRSSIASRQGERESDKL